MHQAVSRLSLVRNVEQSILNLEYRTTTLRAMVDATRTNGKLTSVVMSTIEAFEKTIEVLYRLRATLLRELP